MHDVGPPLGEDSFQFNSICLNGLHSLNLIQHLAGKRNALRFRLDHSTIACYYGISTKLPPPPPNILTEFTGKGAGKVENNFYCL